MRFDAAEYPSVSWDAMTFVCGAGDLYEVRLLDHAAEISGGETTASVQIDLVGGEPPSGIDWLHLHFRDTRYTVASTDCRFETRLRSAVEPGSLVTLYVQDASGFEIAGRAWIERTGTNEEMIQAFDANPVANTILAAVTIAHPAGSYVTRVTSAKHAALKLAEIINTSGDPVTGRFGPGQSGVMVATGGWSEGASGCLMLTFKTAELPAARYGKLGNIDRALVTSGHTGDGDQGLDWYEPGTYRFSGGDNDTKYRIALDFTQPLLNNVITWATLLLLAMIIEAAVVIKVFKVEFGLPTPQVPQPVTERCSFSLRLPPGTHSRGLCRRENDTVADCRGPATCARVGAEARQIVVRIFNRPGHDRERLARHEEWIKGNSEGVQTSLTSRCNARTRNRPSERISYGKSPSHEQPA
jgi:hypothetical protein